MTNREKLKQLIQAWLAGEDTEQGRHVFNRWYNSFNDEKSMLNTLTEEEKDQLGEQLYQRIESSIASSEPAPKATAYQQPGSFMQRNPLARIAAVFLMASSLLLSVLYATGFFADQTAPPPVEYAEASNPPGQTSKITLSDGTTVWLAADSELRYPERFSRSDTSERKVYLSGQAFFDVARDELSPFLVQSGVLRTKVLGTSFNIRAYGEDDNIEVTVSTGQVAIEETNYLNPDSVQQPYPLALLTPDKQIIYEKSTGKSTVTSIDAAHVSTWKEGELRFDNEQFKEITTTFERWYGVEIIFGDDRLKSQRFTFHFTGMPLTYALDMMQNTSDFSYSLQQDTVWIATETSL